MSKNETLPCTRCVIREKNSKVTPGVIDFTATGVPYSGLTITTKNKLSTMFPHVNTSGISLYSHSWKTSMIVLDEHGLDMRKYLGRVKSVCCSQHMEVTTDRVYWFGADQMAKRYLFITPEKFLFFVLVAYNLDAPYGLADLSFEFVGDVFPLGGGVISADENYLVAPTVSKGVVLTDSESFI